MRIELTDLAVLFSASGPSRFIKSVLVDLVRTVSIGTAVWVLQSGQPFGREKIWRSHFSFMPFWAQQKLAGQDRHSAIGNLQ
jgi:hypothetical protein